MADILRKLYYGTYITADRCRQTYYGRYITTDTLWQIYCVPQKSYISAHVQRQRLLTAASEPACCNASPLQGLRWAVLSPVYIEKCALFGQPQGWTAETQGFTRGRTPHGERSLPKRPQGQAPLYILDICIYTFIYIYIYISHLQIRGSAMKASLPPRGGDGWPPRPFKGLGLAPPWVL